MMDFGYFLVVEDFSSSRISVLGMLELFSIDVVGKSSGFSSLSKKLPDEKLFSTIWEEM
jgi:hypothetical protein